MRLETKKAKLAAELIMFSAAASEVIAACCFWDATQRISLGSHFSAWPPIATKSDLFNDQICPLYLEVSGEQSLFLNAVEFHPNCRGSEIDTDMRSGTGNYALVSCDLLDLSPTSWRSNIARQWGGTVDVDQAPISSDQAASSSMRSGIGAPLWDGNVNVDQVLISSELAPRLSTSWRSSDQPALPTPCRQLDIDIDSQDVGEQEWIGFRSNVKSLSNSI